MKTEDAMQIDEDSFKAFQAAVANLNAPEQKFDFSVNLENLFNIPEGPLDSKSIPATLESTETLFEFTGRLSSDDMINLTTRLRSEGYSVTVGEIENKGIDIINRPKWLISATL